MSRMDSRKTPATGSRQRPRRAARAASPLLLALAAVVALGSGAAWAAASASAAAAGTYTGHWTAPAGILDIEPADETTANATYAAQYGFFMPKVPVAIASDETARLAALLPFARAATARVNARYQAALQPQMVLWWTHADGIRGRVSYSNCANEKDQYFTHLHNCDKPWFWQLGAAADQFSYVVYLPLAVEDMYGAGAAANAMLVQRLGQQVLDFDRHVGTTPTCGGYACTFPTTTIADLMADVSLKAQTDGNWYASVLMRDPGIGSWMTARALRTFSHEQTRDWVGCYYAASCWQRLSDRMGDILQAWPSMVRTAATLPPLDPVNPTPTATVTATVTVTVTPTPIQTPVPTATATPTPTATATDTPTPAPTAPPTAAPTETPAITPTETQPATPAATIAPTATEAASPTAPSAPPTDGRIPCRTPPWSAFASGASALDPNSVMSADATMVPICPLSAG